MTSRSLYQAAMLVSAAVPFCHVLVMLELLLLLWLLLCLHLDGP